VGVGVGIWVGVEVGVGVGVPVGVRVGVAVDVAVAVARSGGRVRLTGALQASAATASVRRAQRTGLGRRISLLSPGERVCQHVAGTAILRERLAKWRTFRCATWLLFAL
jgi:hypothetical protein